MIPLEQWPLVEASKIDTIFTDIDDTLTLDGQLPPEAYQALWNLAQIGCRVVPVTGRPAGWCDHIARMWPVSGVIGENGAFAFRYERSAKKMRHWYAQEATERAQGKLQLNALRDQILEEVPGAAEASDQPYRIQDIAIDFCEDVPRLDMPSIERIVAIFQNAGATAKISSIHVNAWFGSFDKMSMIKRFSEEILRCKISKETRRAIYIGDSPNDEPAFEGFQYSVGVSNIRKYYEILKTPPSFVTNRPGGLGFSEVSEYILRAKRTHT